MGKVLVVELARRTVASLHWLVSRAGDGDGLADDEHGGEGEVVVVDDVGEIFQLAAVDVLVGPRQVVAGCDGSVLGIFHEQLALHVVDDGGREEDAHRGLATGQQVELLLLGHGGTALTSGEDDGLRAFGDSELRAQLGSGSEEGGYAGRDVVRHVVFVEEGHLFLYGTEDEGGAGVREVWANEFRN